MAPILEAMAKRFGGDVIVHPFGPHSACITIITDNQDEAIDNLLEVARMAWPPKEPQNVKPTP